MKILYFYQYFSTPKGSWGTRVYGFAKHWVDQGHEVTIVSSIYSKSDLRARKLVENQNFEGIQVKVLNVLIDNKQPFLARIGSFLKYSILSSWYALALPADVVIASSGPITVGLPGLIARYVRKRKLVFETRDLWPEGAIQLGILKNPILQRIAYWFEMQCYVASSHIVTLSPGMKAYIKKKSGIQNITSVTNAANIELFGTIDEGPLPDYLQYRSYAIYTGNIGPVNNSRWLLEAAKELKKIGRNDILILLVGDGVWKEPLQLEAQQAGLDNFMISGLVPKTDLVRLVQNAMVSLVPLKGTPILDTSSPNKFFESLAAGVPVIQNTNGWMKEFIEQHNIGFTIDPDDSKELASLLVELKDNPDSRKRIGRSARKVAARYFDEKYLANKMLGVLTEVHSGKSKTLSKRG